MLSILNKVKGKWAKLVVITAALTVISIAFAAGSMYIAHPTEEHKQVTREFAKLSMSEEAYSNPTFFERKEYRDLESSEQNQHTVRVGFASALVGLVGGIALLVAVYHYLRRYRVTKNAVTATVLTSVIAGMLSSMVMAFVEPWFIGSKLYDPLLMGGVLFFTLLISLPLTYLVVRIIKWNYDRKHSFVVE